MTHEQRYRDIATHLLARYVELFPNYVWTDEETAIDLMAAEIKTLRHEASVSAEVFRALDKLLDMVTDNRLHGPEVGLASEALHKARPA